jgi:hypothetical protein
MVAPSHFRALGPRFSMLLVRLPVAASLEFDHGCDVQRFFVVTLVGSASSADSFGQQ